MSQNLSEKIHNLQKNFLELNNLFELNVISNQACSLDDLINRISSFISSTLNINGIYFFVKNNEMFHSKSCNDVICRTFDFDLEGASFIKLASEKLLEVTDENGELKYKAFWDANGLQDLNSKFFKVFRRDGEIFCICSIGQKQDKSPFSESDLFSLNKIFHCIEPILIKFSKQQEQENQIKELHKSLHNLSILYNISQAVNFIDDLKGLIQVILGKALETIDAEKGSLMLYDYTDNTLQVKVVYGLNDPKHEFDINNGVIECTKLKANEGIAGKVFAEKRSIITNLGQNDPRFSKANISANVSSLICVPLVAKGEAIGVINITNKKNNRLFNKQDLEFIEALANQAAIAIDNAKLYELATKDGLTKLYIYRHFYSLLETELKRAKRYRHVLSLLMMDIDNFKSINDTYGHLIGDRVLKEIAATIKNTVRNIDVPARYGGEEFTVILPETTSKDARIIAERLRQNIAKIAIPLDEATTIKPTISIGIAEFPTNAENEKELIDLADKALYKAKNDGKNCVYEHCAEGFFRCEKIDEPV
ncbi:MAG: sensor domain-containing diguanylate cyclase [Candidatus Gastranaerophilales bacterium]|nr:sensor domain-containing diguanylate cyclase [Candidatus Gastranaerophilales bacterium]